MNDIKNQVLKKILETDNTATLKEINDILDGKLSAGNSRDGYLSVEEALRYLGGINRTTLWKAAKTGKVQQFCCGRRVMYKSKDLDKLLTRKKVTGGEKMDTS